VNSCKNETIVDVVVQTKLRTRLETADIYLLRKKITTWDAKKLR
jgi:hypothetical protein